ncbi:uncharacterized protein LOC107260937 isoform X1 [Ricinus communis]|uniref:uncharacterized protein LOC107260937 isoform X1 n=1 Tax=Ricinus communis TaxID=3988 RepID=UPI00201A66AD|nr:uncharacterized protein LOC107260937 isoform X1 [Ricinus communis]
MQGDEARVLLGFPPSSRPTPSQIKAAYRKKVWESHPDLFPVQEKPCAESRFKSISEAYALLLSVFICKLLLNSYLFSSCEDWHAKSTWRKEQSHFNPDPFPIYYSGNGWTGRIKCLQGIQKAERDISLAQSFSPLMQYPGAESI